MVGMAVDTTLESIAATNMASISPPVMRIRCAVQATRSGPGAVVVTSPDDGRSPADARKLVDGAAPAPDRDRGLSPGARPPAPRTARPAGEQPVPVRLAREQSATGSPSVPGLRRSRAAPATHGTRRSP